MTRGRVASLVIGLGIALSVLFGGSIAWASTFDNPDFAEPLIWLFAGSVAITNVAIFHVRTASPAIDRAAKVANAAAAAGAVAVLAGESEQ